MAVLYHFGIMPKIVGGFAKVMRFFLPISGPEALASSANIFVGQTEAPLVIRPYVEKMTYSELHCLMVGGMATVAGSVLAAFVEVLSPFVSNIGGHLLTASVISAPAAIMFAKILVPETEKDLAKINAETHEEESKKANAIEAAAEGASTGMKMAINIVAMLIAFVALVALVNKGFQWFGEMIYFADWGMHLVPTSIWEAHKGALSLEMLLSILFLPFAFLLGIPASEAALVANLLGEKIIINEFYAYMHLSEIAGSLSERSIVICSYALCGFANFSSIGIQIGGIGEIAPSRKKDLAKLGIRSIIGGSFAAFTTACIASLLI
jgi:CNT family concentrative nucleoside transporter